MSDSKMKCKSCKEPIDENDGVEFVTNDGPYFPIRPKDEGPYCQGCIQADNSEPVASAVFISEEGKALKAVWGNHTIEHVNLAEDYPYDFDWTDELREISGVVEALARGTEWVRSDPWRGYYEMPRRVKKKSEGAAEWIKLVNTWSPTMYDSSRRGAMALSEFYKAQGEGAEVPQLWVFARTSNVCAMGVEVYIKRSDEEKFREMIEAALGSYADDVLVERPAKVERAAAKVAAEA
ncbi:MAG: hypothetical protein ACRD1Z_02970 [Vicinamibacteria bacterium]